MAFLPVPTLLKKSTAIVGHLLRKYQHSLLRTKLRASKLQATAEVFACKIAPGLNAIPSHGIHNQDHKLNQRGMASPTTNRHPAKSGPGQSCYCFRVATCIWQIL